MNFVGRMQRWMDSEAGRTFLNYAYSWGASVVILGALFKLTHLPLANLMLYLGMGTEVLVFFISGFDRPFNKSDIQEEADPDAETADTSAQGQPAVILAPHTGHAQGASAGTQAAGGSGAPDIVGQQPLSPALQEAARNAGIPSGTLADIVRLANEELLQRAQATMTPEMAEASREYVEKLRLLTETLDRVEKQSARLTTDSEEMTNLNRTLTGINTVYELQLKSISQQVGSIDQINEQTRRMARQIEELNAIYARMIKALTVNMKNAAGQADL